MLSVFLNILLHLLVNTYLIKMIIALGNFKLSFVKLKLFGF